MGTTTTAYTRGMTTQPHPQACKPLCHCCILPLAPTPATAISSFTGMQVMFFSFHFFSSLFWSMLQRLSLSHVPGPHTPTSPPHNPHPHAPSLKPHKSLPPLLHCMQACGHLYLHHMQVHHHLHPITVHEIHPQCRLTTCKPHHDAIPTWHARPTTMLTLHA